MATKAAGGPDLHPQRELRAGASAEDRRGPAILSGDAKARTGRRKIAGPRGCRSGPLLVRSPFGRPWRGPLPGRLDFSVQLLNTASDAQSLTVTNTGLAALSITSVTLEGANPGDFTLNDGCSSTLDVGSSCLIQVAFQPTALGPRKAYLNIGDSAAGSPQRIVLAGLGTSLDLSPASLTFSGQTVGTPSSPQTITLTNMGSATINLWQMAMMGTNPGDFSTTTNCGATLATSASCTVNVTFTPAATGARAASVYFSDDAGGSPQSVALSGAGN